ncbi:MAG TPA: phage tail tape measure protein, partial [Desulfatiglandales bacterium]|nr:phage tail tape measure protein [Desulfatiglandales bacterium]
MAKAPVGKIFAELDLDKTKYEKSLAGMKTKGKQTATEIERAWKAMGKKSDQTYDQMKANIIKNYNVIKNHAQTTAADIVRAEKAKNEKISRLNRQQFGEQQSLLTSMKRNWVMYSAAVIAAIYAIRRAFNETRKEFKEFDSALIDMGKVTDRNLALIRKDIMDIDPILGDATSLMKGYYQVISAGVTDPAKALELLTTAAKASKAAHVDQSETIKALTKMMAGYEGRIKTTSDAADLLFAIEKEGQTTVQELVPIIGDISKASKEAGINQYEMAGALALITQTAGSTSEAATQYKSIIMGLLRPNEKLLELITAQGYQSAVTMVKTLGFAKTLELLKEGAENSGISIGKFFRSAEGLLGLSALSANSFETYRKKIDDVGMGAGSAAKAFDEWKDSAEALDAELGANFNRLMIEIGTSLAPNVNQGIRDLSDGFHWLAEKVKEARVELEKSGGVMSTWEHLLKKIGVLSKDYVSPVDRPRGADMESWYKHMTISGGSTGPPSGGGGTPPGKPPGFDLEEAESAGQFRRLENYYAFEQERQRIADDMMQREIDAWLEKDQIKTEFDTKFKEMNMSQYDLERQNIESLAQQYREAGIDKVRIAQWTSEKLKQNTMAETQSRLSMYQSMAGGIANTFHQIAQAGGEQSKKAFKIYKAFAMVEAAIAGAKAVLWALSSAPPPYSYVLAAISAAMAAVQIGLIANAKAPSYDEGGISRAKGVYQTGDIDEAHIPLKGGKVPVSMSGGGKTVIIKMENPVFQDLATQRQVMAQIAEVVAAKVAPGAVVR